MASNFFLSQPSLAKISEGVGNGSSEDDKGRMKHRFSEPWEDSDLILLVELMRNFMFIAS